MLSGVTPHASTLPTLSPSQITALDTYVAAPDSSYSFALNSTITGTGYTDYVINMVSQTWTPAPGDSEVWQHWLQIIVPTTVSTHTAVLNIEGGSNSATAPTTPDALSVQAALALNAITVFLPTVPNEPVTFPAQGETAPLTEDQIVAFTFNQFLNGNGQDWPLLLPMVKSAVRAMDTTQSFVSSQSDNTLSVDNFIVTGASKRGWTTWLTPAVDTRVVAIVPFVFDGLNLDQQLESQLDTYVGVTQDTFDGDSTAVQDYAMNGVFTFIGTPQMQSLLSIVDPNEYVDRSTYDIPKYLVDSTGDQFFVPDAQFFFNDLPGQNYLRYVPNTDHGLNTDAVVGGLNFEKAFLDGASLPQFTWNVSNSGATITLNSATTPSSVTMWQATNTTNRDFRLETFGPNWTSSTLTDQGGGTYVANVTPPATGATDFFIQMQYTVDGVTLTFTTQISTVPLLKPTVATTDVGGVFNGSPFAATATATGPAGLAVPGTFGFTYYAGSTATGTPLASAPSAAGTYTVVGSFTSDDPDYTNGQSNPVTFSISKALPKIVIANPSGTFSGNPFVATATVAGVVTGVDDTPASTLEGVGLTFSYYVGVTTTGTPLSSPPVHPGQYTVAASFGGSQDYLAFGKQFSFVIDLATPTVTVTNPSQTFNGIPVSVTATVAGVVSGVDDTPGSSLEGVALVVSYFVGINPTGPPLSSPPVHPGEYTVSASFAGSQDYRARGAGQVFVIDLATPTVAVTDPSRAFNGSPISDTATITGVVTGVDDTPATSLEGVSLVVKYYPDNTLNPPLPGPPTSPGNYVESASFAGSTDYRTAGASKVFVISAVAPVISVTDAGGTFNGNPFPATATIAGIVSGVDDTPGSTLEGVPLNLSYFLGTSTTGSPLSGVPTDAGQYTALASFPGSTDYENLSQSVTFVISQATPTVVASDAGGNFTGNPYPATATATGVGGASVGGSFVFTYYVGSTVSRSGSTTAPTGPGTFTVVAGFTSGDANYVTGPTSSLPVVFVINPLPVINAPANVSVNQNGSFAFTGPNAISVTDAAGSGNNSETLTLGVGNGTLAFGTTTGLTITNNGMGSVSASGPLASLNADLASLVYTPTSGTNGPDTLNLTILDTTDQAQGNAAKVSITVNPLSSVPSVTAPATASLVENTTLVFSAANQNAISVADASAGTNLEQLTLVATHGTVRFASTAGLTIVSGSNNSASITVKGTLTSLNTDLNGLVFTPTAGYMGPASLTVTFKDLISNQTASATVAITVTAPASTVTVAIRTPLPIAVPFEPVPFLILATDTNAAAQAAPFTFNFNWGDGNVQSVSARSPLILSHVFTRPGVYTVTVTATDEFGHTSAPASLVIRVLFVFVGFNPFNPHQNALIVGGTSGADTVSFTTAAGGGIAVSLNGVAQGVFNTTGPLIVFGGGGADVVTKDPQLSASVYLAESPTDYNLEADLEAQASALNAVAVNAAMNTLGF
jgi:PhoPQ-activated pathogenicity-related protein